MTLLIPPHAHIAPGTLRLLSQNWDTAFLYLLLLVEQNRFSLFEAARLLESGAYRMVSQKPPAGVVAPINKH